MSRFVVDASATLAWLFGEEEHRSRLPADIESAEMIAPWLWRTEVTNAVLVRERRGLLTPADGTRFLQIVDALEVEIVGEPAHRNSESFAHFARPHRLTAYDALYLELAITAGLPLCTFDTTVQTAARETGVALAIKD
jgi:predicted nucleic acid-binding protein